MRKSILRAFAALILGALTLTAGPGPAHANFPEDWPTDFCLSGFVSTATLLDDGTVYVQNRCGDFGGFEYGGPAERRY
jgi:hypothetical protein